MAYTDSVVQTTTLALQGLWLHDPTSPDTSALHYLYGANTRSTDVDTRGEGSWYAGRDAPMVDYGEGALNTFKVGLQVPHGPDWYTDLAALRALARSKRTIFLRDNRGRSAYGAISGYAESDQAWGTEVGFTFTEVEYEIVTVS